MTLLKNTNVLVATYPFVYVPYLGDNIRRVRNTRKVRNLTDVFLGGLEHVLVTQEQNVVWISLGSLPPFEDVVEPRASVTPVL